MRLTVVGCSGSFPGPSSAASCYLVEATDVDGRPYRVVLDLGSGALGPLQRYLRPRDIDAVLLSHLHPDHCLDLTGLYVALKYDPAGPVDRIRVHGPHGVAARMARAYDLPEPGDDPSRPAGMEGEFDFREWVDREPVSIGPFTITPYAVEHPVPAYGLRVAADGAVLAFTGDTDTCDALTPLCAGADLVLADTAFVEGRDTARGIHLTARRAAEAAVEAGGVALLVLTHLPPWNDPEVARADAAAVWTGPLDVARPGASFELGAP